MCVTSYLSPPPIYLGSTFIEVTTPTMPRTGSEDSTCSAGHIELLAEDEDGEDDDDDGEEYLTMEPLRSEHSTVEDDDLELYIPMEAAPSAAASLQATPRDMSSRGAAATSPQRPVSNIDIVTSSDTGVHLLTDERGYTYLDTNLIAELLNQTGREGQRVGSGDPSVEEELYMDPNLMTSSGPYGGEHGKGEGQPGGPSAPGDDDDDDDDAYDEPRLVPSTPSQTAGVLVQRAVPGGDPRTPLASEGNMYVDARLLPAQLDCLGDEKQGEGPGDLDRYDSWNIVADSKASGEHMGGGVVSGKHMSGGGKPKSVVAKNEVSCEGGRERKSVCILQDVIWKVVCVFLVWTITRVYIDLHVHVFIHMGSVFMKCKVYSRCVCAVCIHVMVSEG